MVTTIGAYLGYIGVVVAIIGGLGALYFQKKSNDREAQQGLEDDKAEAVKAAHEDDAREINRLRDLYIEMQKDRDYWRGRCNQMEDRATGRKTEGDQ